MPSFINRIFLATCLIIFITTTPAQAVEINDEGAARLKSMLTQQLNLKRTAIQKTGGNLTTDGEITIEQGKDYYAATMPATTYKTITGENIKVGLVAINAIPTDKSDDWKLSVALPTPILITNDEDKVIKRIDIGTQKMGGLWSASLASFSKLKAQYDSLTFTNVEKGDGFTIDKIIIQSNLKEKEKGLWGGATNISFSNFSANSPDIKNIFSLNEINAVVNIDGYDPLDKDKHLTSLKNGGGDTLLNLLKSSGNIAAKFTLKNLKLNDQNPKNSIRNIELIQFGYSSDAPSDKNVNQGLNLAYRGLKFKKGSHINSLIPLQFKTSLSLQNFPLMDVVNFADKTIGENKDSSARQVAATKAMSFLPEKLKEAGTILLLKNISFGNSLYGVEIGGEIKADPASKVGGMGNLNIETTGLDAVMKELEKTEEGKTIIPQLTMFRMISDEKKDKNIARIKLDKKGNMSINGKDMSGLMGGGKSEAPPAPSK